MVKSKKKVVLITGCSSGIGLSLAVMLAKDEKKRYRVIATMRDLNRKDKLVEAAGDAYGKTLSLAVLDVCNDESVKQCVNDIKGRHVDILINNAGIGIVGPVESITIEEMQAVFETNVFGVIRMIKEVMPDMKKRRAGHIIVISSVLGVQSVGFHDVYAASKFAIEGFCESLAVQLMMFNIKLSLIEPGPVRTDFEIKMIQEVKERECPGADPETVHYFKNLYLPSAINIFLAVGQTPKEISKHIKKVMETSKPSFRNLTNSLYAPIVALKYADESGDLSVNFFYHMLFNLGPVLHYTVIAMRFLSFGFLKNHSVSPK
ncbi:retinol dehydrogenase 8 [Anabas testudineus]|uniref:retinol dehydrogenase 8 n=1 Tax=Anabas testudineus TaxID=64144 RepID=UPI000E4583DC|nr:retinol dehydrogenase 8 [Anabas testudineus]